MATRSQRMAAAMLAAVCLTTVLAAAAPVAAATMTCNGKAATIVGTEGPDRLIGTPGRDVIVGLGGNDVIRGLDGRDTICGGPGRDRIFGGRQADTILGGDDGDRVFGQGGNDRLYGDRGNDRLVGGGGDDDLVGGNGRRDRLIGGSGSDICSDKQGTTARSACQSTQLSSRVAVFATVDGFGGCIESVGISDFTRPADGFVTFSLSFWHGCGTGTSFLRIASAGATSVPGSTESMRLRPAACSVAEGSCNHAVVDTELPVGFASVPLRLEVRGNDRYPSLGETVIDLQTEYRGGSGRNSDVALRFTIVTEHAPPQPAGVTTPGHGAHGPWSTVWGGFGPLPMRTLEVLDTPAELAQLMGGIEVDGIHWPSQAAVAIAIGTDACPPVFAGFEVDDGVASPRYWNPGYTGCIQPLLSSSTIVAVDRDWLDGIDELVLAGNARDAEVRRPVTVSPTSGVRPAPAPIVSTFDELQGGVPLPAPGEAAAHRLSNGGWVIVVHHHGGTVSAFDAVGPAASAFSDRSQAIVSFVGAARTFLGGGAWDEFGRKLDGPISEDLTGYATRVIDGVVEIGDAVPRPAGSRLGGLTSRRAMGDARVDLGEPISLVAALDLPVGNTAFVAAQIDVGPDAARICASEPHPLRAEPCPDDAMLIDGFTVDPRFRTIWFSPILVRRTDDGFDRIVTLGGHQGTRV